MEPSVETRLGVRPEGRLRHSRLAPYANLLPLLGQRPCLPRSGVVRKTQAQWVRARTY